MHFFYCIHCAQCRLQSFFFFFNSLWSWLDSLLFTLFIFIIYHLLFIIGSWQAKLKKTTIWWLEIRRICCLMLWSWWSWLWISGRTYPPLCMTGLTQWNPSDLSVGWQPGLHVGAEQQLYHQIDESALVNFLVEAEKFNLPTAIIESIITSSFTICYAAATIWDRANCSIAFCMYKMW